MNGLNWEAFHRFLSDACEQYQKTAPTVAEYCDSLYVRLAEKPSEVPVVELLRINRLREDGVWMHPNYAANTIYKLMSEIGQDTTGHAGF